MGDDEPTSGEHLFRANKRRKVFRRRGDDDGEDRALDEQSSRRETPGEGVSEELDTAGRPPQSPMRAQKKPASRKYGIAFSTTNNAQRQALEVDEDMAVAQMHPSRQENIEQTDRFVKPTGKAAVVDDKHMMAFVDSKLAELRSATPTPNVQSKSYADETPDDRYARLLEAQNETEEEVGAGRTTAGNGHPKSTPSTSRTRLPTRTRRPPPVRDASDVTRDSLVDQIMKESAVTHYDHSASAAPRYADGAVDNETAVMEAFKTEFLLEHQEHKKRKPPAPPAGTKGVVPTSNGPKLGGSRAQREKMKAAEAAKGGAKK